MSASPDLWGAANAVLADLNRAIVEDVHRGVVLSNRFAGIDPPDPREWTFADWLRIRGYHLTGEHGNRPTRDAEARWSDELDWDPNTASVVAELAEQIQAGTTDHREPDWG